MGEGIKAVVTGIPETIAAFDKLAGMDYSKAEGEAGRAVLSTVRSKTRHLSGSLAGAWAIESGEFINTESYASFQEFGTQSVTPTLAVMRAWDEKQSDVEKAFEKEIDHVAAQAGFDT